MQRTTKILLAIASITAFLAIAVLVSATRPRIVTTATFPNGTQLCVYQEFAGTDLFNTSIYSKKSDGEWGWFYFNHEDLPWFDGTIHILPLSTTAMIYRGERLVGQYDWGADLFTHFERDTTRGPSEHTQGIPDRVRSTESH